MKGHRHHENEWKGFTDMEIEEAFYEGKRRRAVLLSLEREEDTL